jgi:preprotein translocase SecF subunit
MSGSGTMVENREDLPGRDGRRHRFADLYHERTNYQFIERSWRWALLSGTLILISLGALLISGLNLGIDFEGGTQWQFTVQGKSASTDDVRSILEDNGQANNKVLILGDRGVRVQTEELRPAQRTAITDALAEYAGIDADEMSVTNVGPTWGDRVSRKAVQALIVFFIAIALYLSLRFEWRMALAALVAVVHDIIITAGVYAVTGFEVTPATVVAFLTILGFSLYDTVIVFDRIRENAPRMPRAAFSQIVNRSMSEVLTRSLITGLSTVFLLTMILIFGDETLRGFATAMMIGIASGTYSSIFIASPVLTEWKEREPAYRARRRNITEAMGYVPVFPEQNVVARVEGHEEEPAELPEPEAPREPEPEPVAPAPLADSTGSEPAEEPEAPPGPTAEPEPEPVAKPSRPERPRRQQRKRRKHGRRR